MNVTMVGPGRVGLVAAACLADFGISVHCVDNQAEKIESLQAGLVPFHEPGLTELVPPFDAPALAGALERLAQDSRLCSLMGEAGRRRVRSEFDLRTNARELFRLFATLETYRDGGQDTARLLQIELSAVHSARKLRKCDNLS